MVQVSYTLFVCVDDGGGNFIHGFCGVYDDKAFRCGGGQFQIAAAQALVKR